MNTNKIRTTLCMLALVAALPAIAQTAPANGRRVEDVKLAQAGDACRKDVKDYMDTMRFLRQTAGSGIGDKVADGYLSEAEVGRIAATQGHCAAAQLLREKGVRR